MAQSATQESPAKATNPTTASHEIINLVLLKTEITDRNLIAKGVGYSLNLHWRNLADLCHGKHDGEHVILFRISM